MNIERFKFDPTKQFDKPADIVMEQELSKSQKLELLRQWETDALLMKDASAEGMIGGEDTCLREVNEARKAVEAS